MFTKHRTQSDGEYMHIYAVADFKRNSAVWPWVESTSAERVNPRIKTLCVYDVYVNVSFKITIFKKSSNS